MNNRDPSYEERLHFGFATIGDEYFMDCFEEDDEDVKSNIVCQEDDDGTNEEFILL